MNSKSIREKLDKKTPVYIGMDHIRRYSLLLPLIEKEDGTHLLFEVRSLNMRRQPGEICFPGGKVDQEDDDAQETAVREAVEELGVSSDVIQDVYSFGTMLSPGMKVDAYIGRLECEEAELQWNEAEVEETFTVPLEFLLNTEPEIHYIQMEVQPEEGFPYDSIPNGEQYKTRWSKQRYPEHFYHYKGRVIWGLTARILHDFLNRIR